VLYTSIDIETTGLSPETCDIIEFGAVLEDTTNIKPVEELPTFHCYITCDLYHGETFALSMHSQIFRRIATREPGFMYVPHDCLGSSFFYWLRKHNVVEEEGDRISIAGKNVMGFDWRFLRRLPNFEKFIQVKHRVLDPAILFWNPQTDRELPNLKTCLERAEYQGDVAHTAVEDARDVIKLIRAGTNYYQK
jgi:DNA polymerase III epsilon subunit-like protein